MINTVKSDKQLRNFGLIFLGYFLFFSLLLFKIRHHNVVSSWGWLIFAIFLFALIIKPKLLLPLNILWDGLLSALHSINTRILLGIVFFFIFSPIALLRRLRKKDVLCLAFNRDESSYRAIILNKDNNDIRKPY